MKKIKLLLSSLLLLVGVNIQAQSIAAEQMDERFNDGTTVPFGWFSRGWSVKDGLISSKSSSSFGGFGEGGGGGMGNFNPDDFDMSSIFGSNDTYTLLTPPVSVQQGEDLVFSAKKASGGMDMSMGAFFVVEKSVYGSNKWVKVQDFYNDLDKDALKEFKVTATESGEYRYRFRTTTGVSIDSVAGFHIDNNAPDLFIIVEDTETSFVPYGVVAQDSTKTFFVINTGTGPMDVTMSLSNSTYFNISTEQVHVEAGDTAKFDCTFIYTAGHVGWNESEITFTASDNRLSVQKIGVSAVISEPGCWLEDFNSQKTIPYGWFTEGWEWADSAMTVKSSDDMMSASGGYLMTPPLDVRDKEDALVFSVKKSSNGFDISSLLGMFMGGSSKASILTVEKTVYGSNHWEKVHEFTDSIDKNYHTLAVTGFEAGKYRFRFKSASTVAIDSVAGFRVDNNAPDLYVTLDSIAVNQVNYGMQKSDRTRQFIVMNTGTGTLQLGIASSNEWFTVSPTELSIAAGDSATVAVTFAYQADDLGEKNADIIFTPADNRILPQTIAVKAYATYTDAWSEDFEPEIEYVGDDEKSFPVPEGWETNGWVVKKGGSGGIAAMMGGGNNSWQVNSTDNYCDLTTPALQADMGDMLYFEISMGGGGMAAMFGGGGGATVPLTVSFSKDGSNEWQKIGDYTESGAVIFIAPYSGTYKLKFSGQDVMLDNFMGFRTPLELITLIDGGDNSAVLQQYDGQKVNVKYERTLSAVDNGDGTWKRRAYTVCLPYNFNIRNYTDADVTVYSLAYVDNYYNEFIFTNEFSYLTAGVAYLVVVNKGSVKLNAANVTINTTLNTSSQHYKVYDYKSVKVDKKPKEVGYWKGTFETISNSDATAMSMYMLQSDGKMKLVLDDTEDHRKAYEPPFRSFFEPIDHRPLAVRDFTLKFVLTENGEENDEVTDFPSDLFEGDWNEEGTGIDMPVIHTIDSDGTHRYYDLQGRQLDGKPNTGIYIKNGKKYSK